MSERLVPSFQKATNSIGGAKINHYRTLDTDIYKHCVSSSASKAFDNSGCDFPLLIMEIHDDFALAIHLILVISVSYIQSI